MASAIFEVRVLREVADALAALDDGTFDLVARAIDSLAFAPRREDAEELDDGFWLLRAGRFAIVYAIEDSRLVVVVVRVGGQAEILAEAH